MEIGIRNEGSTPVLALKGRLDVLTSKELQDAVLGQIEGGAPNLIIDFSQVEYVSSSGLRVLLQARKLLKTRGGLVILCNLNDFVKGVIEATGFDTIFTITPGIEGALVEVRSQTS